MQKNNHPMLKHFVLSFIIMSCQNETTQSENSVTKNPNNGTVINGRFYFSSKENLKKNVEELKKKVFLI